METRLVKWVLQIGLNPGGPPGVVGSGTQYIVGSFNGTAFVADSNNPPPLVEPVSPTRMVNECMYNIVTASLFLPTEG